MLPNTTSFSGLQDPAVVILQLRESLGFKEVFTGCLRKFVGT